ncbi:MAG: glycine cleavage system aminomethyltransferase GcvT [Promethearchaeota archaeon]
MSTKRSPLHEEHAALGASFGEFAGWTLPIHYGSVIREHEATRTNAGLFDVSHMGELVVEGRDAADTLQHVSCNDLDLLEPGKGQYACFCKEAGGVVDDLWIYEERPGTFRLIVNAANVEKDVRWLRDHATGGDFRVDDQTAARARLAFQGPGSDELLGPLVDVDVEAIPRFRFVHCRLAGTPAFLAKTGYTGERGFEASVPVERARDVWRALLETGATPAGLGARDTLRLEACYSLYGHELSENVSPVEAGVGWVVKEKPGVDFVGKAALLRQKEGATQRVLVGLKATDRGVLRERCAVHLPGEREVLGEVVGETTSGGYSPTLKASVALALVKRGDWAREGERLLVRVRKRVLGAAVVPTPFYRNI